MTRYVTDLLNVKPEEIQHVEGLEVQGIVHCPDTIAHGTITTTTVVVVFKNGGFSAYTPDGKGYPGNTQKFVYKPRTKRVLKPLHQILTENLYYIGKLGTTIYFPDLMISGIRTTEMPLFTGTAASPGWPDSFYMDDTSTIKPVKG